MVKIRFGFVIALSTGFVICLALLLWLSDPISPRAVVPVSEVLTSTTISYQEDPSIFPNPERGWYWSISPWCCSTDQPHPPLTLSQLNAIKAKSEKVTIINDRIQLGQFMSRDIDANYLQEIRDNLAVVRQAGMKTILRFLYDWSIYNRDADKVWIERHMDQLAPIIRDNVDVILWVQAGFYGGSGEANASDHGYVSSDLHKKLSDAGAELYVKWFRILPQDRMMVFRYPRLTLDMKLRSFPQYNWSASIASRVFDITKVLTESQAFSGSDDSRMGYYSDGYMGNSQHYAMFQLPIPPGLGTEESEFVHRQTNYVPFEGEISQETSYNTTPGNVVLDMTRYHTTAFNLGVSDGANVFSIWKTNGSGDWDAVTRRLGYRYRLTSVTLPNSYVKGSGNLNLTLRMRNDGFARIMNPRKVEIILRNKTTGQKYVVNVDNGKGNRLWLPGPAEEQNLTISVPMPSGIIAGSYDVILNLPDPYAALHDRPEYSIRLANTGVWEASTGYNLLGHTLVVSNAASTSSAVSTVASTSTTASATSSQTTSIVVSTLSSTYTSVKTCLGDYNGEKNIQGEAVDISDFAIFATLYKQPLAETERKYDLVNTDGQNILNLADFSRFAVNYKRQVCVYFKP